MRVKLNPNERELRGVSRSSWICPNLRHWGKLTQIERSILQQMISLIFLILKQFKSSEHYYATYFHELVHSTGHSSRLARPGWWTLTDLVLLRIARKNWLRKWELHFFVLIPKLIMIPLSKTMLRIWLDGSKLWRKIQSLSFRYRLRHRKQ